MNPTTQSSTISTHPARPAEIKAKTGFGRISARAIEGFIQQGRATVGGSTFVIVWITRY